MRMTRKQRRRRQRRLTLEQNVRTVLAKSAGLAAAAVILANGVNPGESYAMPTGGEVAAGSAVINQAGQIMTIQQQTMQAILNWHSFGILPNEQVNFLQPGSDAVLLNRVLGNNPSAIFGKLTANGKVFLVNPNGVFFAKGAQVNVGGLVASTLTITDADFMAGRYAFVNQGTAQSVINQGNIIAKNQGLVALLAPTVQNEGIIAAKKGTVALAAGDKTLLDFNGDGKVQIVVANAALQALAENKGLIEADGGIVLMTAGAGQQLTSAVVNQSGIIRAGTLSGKLGAVTLAADGMVNMSGTIDVSGAKGAGGTVDVFANTIAIDAGAIIDASGNAGGGKIRIGGDWQGRGDAPHADKVTVAKGAALHADAGQTGNGGTVVLWSDGMTKFDGTITATGGAISGDGGNVETSGQILQIRDGKVNAAANNGASGEWLLDPGNIEIVGSGGNDDLTASKVNVSAITQALNAASGSTNVTVQAKQGSGEDGNITVNAAITKSLGSAATLKLSADGQINVNEAITSQSDKLNVDLHAGQGTSTSGAIAINAPIVTNGGNINLHGGQGATAPAINNASGHGITLAANLDAGVGNIELQGMTTDTSSGNYGVHVANGVSLTGTDVAINQGDFSQVTNKPNGTVYIDGQVLADGDFAITGLCGGSPESAITWGSGANITAKNLSLTGDSMSFNAGARANSRQSGVLAIKQLTAGTTIGLGSGTGALQLSDVFGGSSVFTGFQTAKIGDAKSGTLTVDSASFGNDVVLQSGGAVSVGTQLNAGSHNVRLAAGADSTGAGIITANGLDLQGTAAFTLTGANEVTTLAGNVKKVDFVNNKALSVGTVSVAGTATNGLTIAGSNTVNNLTANGDLTVAQAITATAANLNLTATGGAIALRNNAAVNSGSGDITLKAGTGLPDSATGTIAGTGTLTLDNAAAGGTINIGGTSTGLYLKTAAFTGPSPVFGDKFTAVIIGGATTGAVNIAGDLTVNDSLTVNSGTKIDFAAGGALQTGANEALTLNAPQISFTGKGVLNAGSGNLTLNTNKITGWTNATFTDTNSQGNLVIAPQTTNWPLYIGETAETNQLGITTAGFNKIAVGKFLNATLGKTGAAGAVTLNSLTQPAKNLTINGGAGTIASGAAIQNTPGQTLTLNLAALTQNDDGSLFNIGGNLALAGAGDFWLKSINNKSINNLTATVNNLEVWSEKLGLGTNTATGNITLKIDQIDKVTGKVAARDKVFIEKLSGTDKVINIGGTGTGSLDLAATFFSNITGSNGIQIGDKTNTQTINLAGDTTFQSALELWTKQALGAAVNINSNVTVKGNTTIYTWAWTLPTYTLTTQGLTLDIGQGLTGIGGKVAGAGALTINKVTGQDIYLTDNASDAGNNYQIEYQSLNNMGGFGTLSVEGTQNVILKDGTLNQSTNITSGASNYGVTVDGAVNIGTSGAAKTKNVAITGGKFTVNNAKSLQVNSAKGTVSVNAAATELTGNGKIDVGGSNFSLTTNKLTAGTGAKIVGENGNLTVQQTSGTLYVGDVVSGNSGLEITNAMLGAGGLFGDKFGKLTLGAGGAGSNSVEVNDAKINNNVTILAGKTGTIAVKGTNGLEITGTDRQVTLQGGTITNNRGNSAIDVGSTGTIRLYTNDLSGLMGTGQVTGQGTLGIGSYDGSKAISLGDTAHDTGDLHLKNDLFSSVFAATFTKYDIGNARQENIYVNAATLGKDLMLTAKNIEFTGNLTLNDSKNLTLTGVNGGVKFGNVKQSGGIIAAHDLVLNAGDFALTQAGNRFDGTVSTGTAGAHDIAVAGSALTLGALHATGGGAVAGNIELASDQMTFNGKISGAGELYVHQTSTFGLSLGTATDTGLKLGSGLFNGQIFSDGFKEVSLGNKDGKGLINIGGVLNFLDNTTIYGTRIKSYQDTVLTTQANNLTLVTDDLDLQNGSKISGSGDLTIETVTTSRDLYLGDNATNIDASKGLVLQSNYFQANANRVFGDGYANIILGRSDGTGTLTQAGTTNFTDNVIIRQAKDQTSGGYYATGTINTNNQDFTVESQTANFNQAQVTTGTGAISIKTDKLTITDSKFFGSGGLTLNTYTADKAISLGSSLGGSLNLASEWFGNSGAFSEVSGAVTIGGAGYTGTISLDSAFTVNNDLTLTTTGTISGANMLTSNNLTLSGSTVNLGAVTTDKLTATSSGDATISGNISNIANITSGGSTIISGSIGSIDDITSKAAVTITNSNAGTLTINGKISATGNNETVTIVSGGNLELGAAGAVSTNKGTISLTTEKNTGHFINNNTSSGNLVMDTNGAGHWLIFTSDSQGDNYGNLIGEIRKYGTDADYGDAAAAAFKDANGIYLNGSAHFNTPVATIYGEKTYGNGNSAFFDPNKGFKVTVDQTRLDADKKFLGANFKGLLHDPTDATQYNMQSLNEKTIVNTIAYGTGNNTASYAKGANPMNYKVNIDFWVKPKTVCVKANTPGNLTYNKLRQMLNSGVSYGSWTNGAFVADGGFVNGETFASSGTTGILNYLYGGNANGQINAGAYTIDISGSNYSANNYVFQYLPGVMTIDPKSITIDISNGARLYGQLNSFIKANGSSAGLIAGDTITNINVGVNGIDQFANVGNYLKALNVMDYTIDDGNGGKNYTVTLGTGDLTINKRPLIITAQDLAKIYGDIDPTTGFDFNIGATDASSGLVNGDHIDFLRWVINNPSGGMANVGTINNAIVGSGANFTQGTAGNYAITYKPGDLKINKREVWLYANDLQKLYDKLKFGGNGYHFDSTDAAHYFANGQDVNSAGITNLASIIYNANTGNAWGQVNVGEYTIGLGGNLAADNYEFKYKPGKLKITPKTLTINAGDAWRYYGQANAVAIKTGGNYLGLLDGDTIANINVGVNGIDQFANVGNYLNAINVTDYTIDDGNGGKNYTVTLGTGDLTINKRKLTITAQDFERIYGELDPTKFGQQDFVVGSSDAETGLVNGDYVSSLLDWAVNNPAGTKADVGVLTGVISGENAQFGKGDCNNYDITYKLGDLKINKRDVYINAGAIERIYGDHNMAIGSDHYTIGEAGSKVGLVNGDSINGVTLGYADFVNWLTDVGEYNNGVVAVDAVFDAGKAENYTVHYNPGTFTVTARPVLITAGDAQRYYGDLNPAVLKFLQEIGKPGDGRGLINGDKITGVTQSYDQAMNQFTNAGNYVGVINASDPVLTPGVRANNYSFEYQAGNLLINKALLTIIADDKNRPYNTQNPDFTVHYDGLKNGEDGAAVINDLQIDTTATTASAAGKYAITPGKATASNYEISYKEGTLTILPAGGLVAVDTAKVTTKPQPIDSTQGTVAGVLGKLPAALPELMGDIDPNTPALNMAGKISIIDVAATVDSPQGNLDMQVQGKTGTYNLYADRHGFGMLLDGNTAGYDMATSKTNGAIPVLYTDYSSVGTDHEQLLDGFYAITYKPTRLSIEPAPQGTAIPKRSELKPDLRQDYSVVYQDDIVGTFQVAIGAGIVTIHPKDKQALDTILNATKASKRAVLTAGVLRSVRDFGITVNQVRGIYIFREILTLATQARKG